MTLRSSPRGVGWQRLGSRRSGQRTLPPGVCAGCTPRLAFSRSCPDDCFFFLNCLTCLRVSRKDYSLPPPPLFLSLEHPEIKEEVSRKDNKLLSLLKDVYVDSKDPVTSLPVTYALIKQTVHLEEMIKEKRATSEE